MMTIRCNFHVWKGKMKCFKIHEEHDVACKKEKCKYWINHEKTQNCTIIASSKGPMTLQEIGEIFGVTRMRICQIEKKVLEKIGVFINDCT